MNFKEAVFTFFAFFSLAALSSCSEEQERSITGPWRGLIESQNQQIPFNFEISEQDGELRLTLINAEERLDAGPIERFADGDSLRMPMHIFDAEILAKVGEDGLYGSWIKNYVEDYELPFRAIQGDTLRIQLDHGPAKAMLEGKWDVTFLGEEGTAQDKAVGIFKQKGDYLTGTFMTTTGDYRYLEGLVSGDRFALSTFDGEHAYLFKGQAEGDSLIRGDYWSGKGWHETWVARRDENAALPNADSLTFLNEGYDTFNFAFPNLQGDTVRLSDPKFQDKVVIVQLFGTWCPNCMDETRFLADWYRRNQDKPVEVIGLAFEKKADFDYASERVQRMVEKMDVGYDFLIAGSSAKEAATEALPMLNHVMSFPTTIFIDKDGKVRRIHTGFSGPGTGSYYEEFTAEFNRFMQMLLEEGESA